MKVNQIIKETTTAGSVATVSKPIGETGKQVQVRGLQPAEKIISKKTKKKGPYANSLVEGKMKELAMDLKTTREGLTDQEFKNKYGKTKDEMRASLKQKPPVKEAKLDEEDLILYPGNKIKRKTGFVKNGESRIDHEVEMARSDVLATIKNAKSIYSMLKNKTEEEGIEGWVQEKLIKANDYLNSVKEYYDEKNMHEMSGGVIAGGGVGEARIPQLPTRGADYSKYDTDHLETLLRPGILHRNELGFKKLIRKELERRRQAQPVNPKDLVVSLSDVPVKKPRGHTQYDPSRDFPSVFKEQGVAEGNNSSPYDEMARLKSKTNKELDELVQFWQKVLEKRPDDKIANDQLHIIKMIRAERIGKKGVAESSFNKCFDKACKLYDKTVEKDLNPILYQVADYKGDGSNADSRWAKLPQHVWSHYVTVIGDTVYDPSAKQFGPDKSEKYNINQLEKEWGKIYKIRPKQQGVSEGLGPDTQRLEQDIRDALANGDDYTAKQYARMAPTPEAKKYLQKIIRQEMYGTKPGQGGVSEGAKVDRMVQHIKKSEIKTGKSPDKAEDIAWATVNKLGYLDNKNKKVK